VDCSVASASPLGQRRRGLTAPVSLPAYTALVSPRRLPLSIRHWSNDAGRYRNIDRLSIGFASRLRLRPDSPAAVRPCGGTLRLAVVGVLTPLLCYSFRHSHSSALHRGFRYGFDARTTLPYRGVATSRSVGTLLCPVEASAQRYSTSELLRTLSRVAASKPTSWLSARHHNLSH